MLVLVLSLSVVHMSLPRGLTTARPRIKSRRHVLAVNPFNLNPFRFRRQCATHRS